MSITAIFQLVSLALSAVTQAEELYKEAKSGAIKKSSAVQFFTDGMKIAQTAGAPISDDLRAELTPAVPDLIEQALTMAKTLNLIPSPATEAGH